MTTRATEILKVRVPTDVLSVLRDTGALYSRSVAEEVRLALRAYVRVAAAAPLHADGPDATDAATKVMQAAYADAFPGFLRRPD